ncbi:Exopolysaccharide production protein ExoZ [Labilithrix luteola]|uniref:Exopolysaccharide production protein ExoZ n=1 Tax=Labilithrix luteola TaxID=1391654 RepID=A0A0K1PYH0_9BACT|nr:acyltransferase [Labilithrix luteola]AKU98431.1 Exopolysaccharide production protein ExoZ [Labilithrix luteola]
MRAPTLYNLHLLRVIAALSVVYFHTTSTAGLGLRWDVGSRGVDVFFVISGFIIAYIGTVKPEQFFRRRLIRVVPFYWAATLCVFAMVAAAPRLFRSATSNVPHLVASLLFVPHLAPNGETMPTLLLGWSLNFEVFFYLLFALALRISPKWSPAICVGWIVAFVLAIHGAATENTLLTFYARPIVLEFCYGIGVFYLFRWCTAHAPRLARHTVLKWLLLFVLVGSFVALNVLERYYRDAIPRYLIAGIPSFFIVISALLLERIYGLETNNRLIHLLGESSYIIYLVHPYVVFTVLRVVVKDAGSYSPPALCVLIVGLLAFTSAIAIGIHVWFEKPVMAFLRARLSSPA